MGLALLCLLIALCASAWHVMRTPDTPVAESLVVNDVSQLNPIRVSEIITPSDTREIVDAIKRHSGPISIGGARHSMGGQIAAQGGLHVDMRHLNRILEFRPDRKEITVQAGTRWRQIQEHISEAPLTIADRLIPGDQEYRFHRLAFWTISEWPAGQGIRRLIIDPIYFSGEPVTWRNYEASYDADELEPASRRTSTYALQEYFVPIDRFDDFVAALRLIVRRHPANIVNVSIRHSMPDHQSLLSWVPNERFAFVIYYKQGTSEEAKRAVGLWTRALIDAALKVGGTFYLPYQLHATGEQFRRGYPRFPEYVTLKRRVDPGNKFRNTLLDKYLRSSTSPH